MEKIKLGEKLIGKNERTFIVAEMSANHLHDFNRAVEIVKKAKESGADAIKVQTYTPDSITIDCDNDYFKINQGTIWDGETLYNLYKKAYMPWEWQSKLKEISEDLGMIFFSSPFDFKSVDFLEEIGVEVYKIASFEITDIPLVRYIASKKKPIFISTGIAKLADIELAINECKKAGNQDIVLLKCTSEYPAKIEDANIRTILNMKETFNVVTGLSDHTMGNNVALAAVSLGASVIEKHFTLNRADGGPDSKFSMEPHEFKKMVEDIREIELALGKVSYELTEKQIKSREHGRSLFIVKDIQKDEIFTAENVKSIRPGYGLESKYIDKILGEKSRFDLKKGTPLEWKHIK